MIGGGVGGGGGGGGGGWLERLRSTHYPREASACEGQILGRLKPP